MKTDTGHVRVSQKQTELRRGASWNAGETIAAAAPATLTQALQLLDSHRLRPIAGGTDLVVRHRRGADVPVDIGAPPLFVAHLPELKQIAPQGEEPAVGPGDAPARAGRGAGSPGFAPNLGQVQVGTGRTGPLSIGAAVTLSQLEHSHLCPPALAVVIPDFASPAVRTSATIGGNICNASPAGDLLPPLYAHGAAVEIVSRTGSRTVPIGEFITGPGSTTLASGELLSRIHVPSTVADYRFYRKVAARRSNALSKLSVYVAATFEDDRISRIAIALGAVGPTVIRLAEAEELLTGLTARDLRGGGRSAGTAAPPPRQSGSSQAGAREGEAVTGSVAPAAPATAVDDALALYAEAMRPIDDQRSRATYRKNTALRLLRFVLTTDLPAQLAGGGTVGTAGSQETNRPQEDQ